MRISVVIPAYNAAAYLEDAIKSAQGQTQPPLEIIVLDDGSTDSTGEIARRFGSDIVYLRQSNRGLSAARNRAIVESRGDWIALLDADDMWDARKLELQRAALKHSPAGTVLSYTGHSLLKSGGIVANCRVPDSKSIAAVLRERCAFMPSSVLVRKDVILKAGGFNESFRSAPEDWELWIRLLRQGCTFIGVPDPLLIYRDVPTGLTHKAKAFLEGQRQFVRSDLNADLPFLRRWVKTRRVISRLESEAALVMREQRDTKHLPMMFRSLLTWPFLLNWKDRRYKVVARMLLAAMGRRRISSAVH